MAGAAGTTTLLSEGCPKHAYALPAFLRSRQRPLAHSKPARKRAFCPSRRLRHASDISVAGDDPVNEGDPSGKATVGFCGFAGFALAGPSGFGSGCLTRTVTGNSDQIGVVGTYGGGGAQSISGFAQFGEEFTNATSLDQLRGPFAYFILNVGDIYGGSVTVFAGGDGIFGIQFSGGYSINFAKRWVTGAPFTIAGGADKSFVTIFHHLWETVPADLSWDALSFALGQPPVYDALRLAKELLNEISARAASIVSSSNSLSVSLSNGNCGSIIS